MSAERARPGSALTAPASIAGAMRRKPDVWPLAWMPGLLHLGLVGVLLVEVGLVRGHFDTDGFLGDGRILARLLFATRNAAPVGIASAAFLVLLGWPSLVREYARLRSQAQGLARSLAACLLHALLFALFYRVTQRTFASAAEGSAAALAWSGAWGLGVLALPLSAASIAFRPAALVASARRLLPILLVAVVLGVLTFALSRAVLDSGLWYPLQVATTRLARALLWLATGDAAVGEDPFVLRAGNFHVLVTSFCSGFEGVALITTFLAAYFIWFRRSLRFPQVLVLLPLAAVLLWLANGVRLAALVWIGARVSPEIAMQGFHSYAGWVAFCALALAVVHLSCRVSWFAHPALAGHPSLPFGARTLHGGTGAAREGELAAAPERADTVNPAAVYLGPFLAILAVSFVSGAFASGLDRAYPLRVLAGLAVLWRVRGELPRFTRAVPWTGVAYGVAAFALWIALEGLGPRAGASASVEGLAGLSPWAARLWLAFRALGFLLLAPVAEELAFRGFLARRLVSADFEALSYRAITPLAWCLSSLGFGLLHGQWIAATLAGALFGLAAIHRGRLGDALAAHVTTNALLLLASLAFGPWHGWL